MYKWEVISEQAALKGHYRKSRYVDVATNAVVGFVFSMGAELKQWRASTSVIIGTYATEAEAKVALEASIEKETANAAK
jgi:hypothetical protein